MLKVNIFVRVAVCFLFVFMPLHNMDEWFYDRLFQLKGHRHQPTPFVLIRVNDAKLYRQYAKENLNIPQEEIYYEPKAHSVWYRDFYENLLKQIEADKPKLVIFASYFDAVTNQKHSNTFSDNVIFSAVLSEENKLVPPPLSLTKDQNYGFNNTFPDSDNVVRKTHLVYSSGASLSLRAYHRVTNQPINRDLLEPLWIDFRGPSGSYPSYEAWDLSDEEPPPGTFKNKIVLIGREGSPSSDLETPYGRMSRLEIQANAIDTFLDKREIRILPRMVTLIVGALVVGISIVIILYFSLTLAWLLLLLFSVLVVLIALFVFSELKMWAGVANPIVCIFATHLLMLGFKLSRQEEEQWKIQQESQYLKEMDQFKNNFISLFSHDLKTPISKIKAIIDRLITEHRDLSPEVLEGLKSIDRTNTELARFISDILKVTKMESMSLEPTKEVIDLNRLVEEAVQRLKFIADEKHISIIMDLEPLFSMEGDRQLILEVITNLLENAIKYSQSNRRVVIRTAEEDQAVRISVIDQGEGIPPDEVPRVTGKFYRGRKAAQTAKGSGLGLYLAKYFVELHQGELEIKSEVGKGTEVSFWLPLST